MADTLRIYHKREEVYGNELNLLKGWNISAKNKELITQFHNHRLGSLDDIQKMPDEPRPKIVSSAFRRPW